MEDEWHACHFCGASVKNGVEPNGTKHWLSDCRPDLVNHEPGDACTWAFRLKANPETPKPDLCYAYNEKGEHVEFYPDGPM